MGIPPSRRYPILLVALVISVASLTFFTVKSHSLMHRAILTSDSYHADTVTAIRAAEETLSLRQNPPTKKMLPMLKETGGLVVFLHVAKCGGSTIRYDFADKAKFPKVKVKRVMGDKQLRRTSTEIDSFLSATSNTANRTLLLEIHGGHGQPMTIFEIHPLLQTWRSRAAANGKSVFVFTLLREPTAFYVSYFNFFKHSDCKFSWCDPPLVSNLTEDNLLASLQPNHQCQFLARPYDPAVNAQFPVTQAECEAVYRLLQADADWIGTTESMQDVTLPLLSQILSGNAETGRSLEAHNKQQNTAQLSLESLSAQARQRTRDVSEWDRYLYESAARDYRLDMWEDFGS